MNYINKRSNKVFLAIAVTIVAAIGIWWCHRAGLLNSTDKNENQAALSESLSSSKSGGKSPERSDSKGKIPKAPQPKLTPDLAKSELEKFFAKTNNVGERCNFARELIKQLCENGYTNEAFQMLEENASDVRINEIVALFQFASLSNSELLKRFDEISVFDRDKERALRGYLARFQLNELTERASDPAFQAMLSQGQKMSSGVLSRNLAYALEYLPLNSDTIAGSPAFLSTAKELVDKGLLNASDFVAIAAKGFSLDPGNAPSTDVFERWRQIQEVIPAGPLGGGDGVRRLVVDMVTSDGPRALDNLLQNQDYQSVGVAINQWLSSDSAGVSQWYEKNANRLSPNQNDAVTSTFSSTALQNNEFDGARAWAEKLQDPTEKTDLLNKIAEQEKKTLGGSAATDNKK